MELYKNGYELTFEEDFSEGLEKNKWTALDETVKSHSAKKQRVIPTHVITSESAKHTGAEMHYKPENVYAADGHLVIKADRDGDGFQGGKVVCNGVVFARGYVEVEVLLPEFQKGVWPVFGIESTKGNLYETAFDIVSVHGDKGKNAFNLYIRWTDEIYEGRHQVNGLYGKPGRFYPDQTVEDILTPGYHKFGIEILEDYIIFYADGQAVNRIHTDNQAYSVFGKKTFYKFTAGMSVGLPNIDPPEDDANFPTEFKVKNIKVYQRDDGLLVKK